LNNYYADIKKEGLTAEFKYLDPSSEFYWAPPGYSNPISYDDVVTALTQNAPLYSSVENKWNTLRIDPLTQDLSPYTGRIHSSITDTSGIVSNYNFIETGLMIKRKDGWKLLRGQTSVIE